MLNAGMSLQRFSTCPGPSAGSEAGGVGELVVMGVEVGGGGELGWGRYVRW